MDIGRAVSYIFEDREWTPKLLLMAGIALAGLIGLIFLGLGPIIAWSLLLGYAVELVRNVRDNHPIPLPRWDNYAEKFRKGGSVLAAVFVYNLPNLLPACCYLTTAPFWRDNFFGSAIGFAVVCCILPLILIYNVITWPMLALGLARFADEENIGVFFQFGDLFRTAYRGGGLTITLQWVLYSFIANFVLSIVAAVPCIGWAAAPALAVPIHGHLVAQYAARVDEVPRVKKKKR
ncbi:MAG: DUF4013 domain-containing protein [Anaerolineae bacterium]